MCRQGAVVQKSSIFTSFHPKQFDNFSREIKVEFWDKKMKISNSLNISREVDDAWWQRPIDEIALWHKVLSS